MSSGLSRGRIKQLHLLALYKAKRFESLWHFLDEIQPDIPNDPDTNLLVFGTYDAQARIIEVGSYMQRLWPMAEVQTEYANSFLRSMLYAHSCFVIQLVSHLLGPHKIPHAHVIKCRYDIMIDPKREFSLAYREH